MTSESETNQTETALHYHVGDEVSVNRGKARGQNGKVLGVDEANKQYSVQYNDGTFGIVNAVSVNPPADGFITGSNLAGLVAEWEDSNGDGAALVKLLGEHVEGFARAYDNS